MQTQNLSIEKLAEIDRPLSPGHWPLDQIQAALSRPLPKGVLATRKQGGAMIEYIPWHVANRILDKYCPGWRWEVKTILTTPDRLVLVGRLTIPTRGGDVWREATGTEELKERNSKTGELQEIAYGDPASNSESMAFRRAAAKFGLGLYLYQKN